jgi:hypothetical protein
MDMKLYEVEVGDIRLMRTEWDARKPPVFASWSAKDRPLVQ